MNNIDFALDEQKNFLKLTEALDILVSNQILTEDNVFTKVKDVVVKTLKRIWVNILTILEDIKQSIQSRFNYSLRDKWKKISKNIDEVISKKDSNNSIHNELLKNAEEAVYGMTVNGRETYLMLDEADQEKFSIKNAFKTVYESYKKTPKNVEWHSGFSLKNLLAGNAGKEYYTFQKDTGAEVVGKAKEYFYKQLDGYFDSHTEFKVSVKKYTENLSGDTTISNEKELDILKKRINSSIDAMTEISKPYKDILGDKLIYGDALKQFTDMELLSKIDSDKYKMYKSISSQLIDDLNFYKTMIKLYSAVFTGLLKECFYNMSIANTLTNKIGKLKVEIQGNPA